MSQEGRELLLLLTSSSASLLSSSSYSLSWEISQDIESIAAMLGRNEWLQAPLLPSRGHQVRVRLISAYRQFLAPSIALGRWMSQTSALCLNILTSLPPLCFATECNISCQLLLDGCIKDEKEKDKEIKKGKDESRGSHEGGLHPSLYPILLLLSKMRPAAEESPHTVITDAGVATRLADISLFVPLVVSCRDQQSQKVSSVTCIALHCIHCCNMMVQAVVHSILECLIMPVSHNTMKPRE